LSAAAILLCESDGTPEEVTEEIAAISALMQQSGARQLKVSQSEAERLKYWAGRKAAFPAVGRITPDYLCMDGTIPRKHLAHVLTRIAELSAEFKLRCANVFHAGDGNLHPLIMFDARVPGETERAIAFGAQILELSVDVGGTITGEHGVGIEKVQQMCVQFSPEELETFHAVKATFDPLALLNPGKAVPVPRHCSEYRLTGSAR
jgi:glycolate oxidase